MPDETVSATPIGSRRRFRDGEREAGDARVAKLARRQHGVVGREQLRALDLGERAIQHRLEVGRLHRIYPGVYAVGHRLVPKEAWWIGAVLASGPGAVLSHRSAAALWRLRNYSEGAVHVTVAHKSTSSKEICRHHSLLPVDEIAAEEGIPVTTVPRTIFDLAATESADVVEAMLREAEYRRLYDRLSLGDLARRYPGRRGVRKVRMALERLEALPPGRRRSALEERFVPFLRCHRLPQPRFNDWIILDSKLLDSKRFQVDCHWPGTGQIVELDGWKSHGTRSAFREDRARDRALRVAGYTVTRIAWAQLDDEPEAIAADLRALLKAQAAATSV